MKVEQSFLENLGIKIDDEIVLEDYNPSEHINKDNLKNLNEEEIVEGIEEYEIEKEKHYNIIDNKSLTSNIVQFTRLKKEITSDDDYEAYNNYIEEIRLFPKNFLKKKGIFLSLTKQDTIDTFPYLRNSSLYQTTTDEAYGDRYMLPICLPNGDVIIHTGYRPTTFNIPGPKYETSFYSWMSQGSVLGNMESLMEFPNSKRIYVVEGMFDAYRINQVLKEPSIALLGSLMTKEKMSILNILKSKGYELILVPDQDEAGLNTHLLNSNLFSCIVKYGDPEVDKDFDFFCGSEFIKELENKHNSLNNNLEFNLKDYSLFDLTESEIDKVNKIIVSKMRYEYKSNNLNRNSMDIFKYL